MMISLDFCSGSVSVNDVVSISFDVVSLNGFVALVIGFVVEQISVVDFFVAAAAVVLGLAVTGFVVVVVVAGFVVVFVDAFVVVGFPVVSGFVFAGFDDVFVVVVSGSAGFAVVGFAVAGFLVVGFVVAGFVVVADVFVSKDG